MLTTNRQYPWFNFGSISTISSVSCLCNYIKVSPSFRSTCRKASEISKHAIICSSRALIAPVMNTPSVKTVGDVESSFLYPGLLCWLLPSAQALDLMFPSRFSLMKIKDLSAYFFWASVISSGSIGT